MLKSNGRISERGLAMGPSKTPGKTSERRVGRLVWTVLIIGLLFTLASCAAGPNPARSVADQSGEVAGFWLGLWHGIIAPVTFLISLFSDTVNVYDVHNNGNWYNFGFVLGAGILFGGGAAGARKKRD
jgi:hypothetical protein